MENLRKYSDINLVTTERRRNYSLSEPNYHTTKFFTENLLAIEIVILISKPIYLGLLMLGLGKTAMHEFWYDYIKPKYGAKAKLSYLDTDSFIIHVEREDIYKDIAEDVQKIFDTLNYEIDKPLPMLKNNKGDWINERRIRSTNCENKLLD